jgi:hypothetical protein
MQPNASLARADITTTRTPGRRNPQNRGMIHMSKITLIKMALAGTLVIATATPIGAQTVFANGNKRSTLFTMTASAVPAPGDSSRCGTPINPANFPCVLTNSPNTATFHGDLEGVASQAGNVALGAGLVPVPPATFSIPFVSWLKVTGTVEGCGTGSFILENRGIINGVELTGSWQVVKDSGIGELAKLRGSGNTSRVNAAGVVTKTYTGRLRCGDSHRGNQDD